MDVAWDDGMGLDPANRLTDSQLSEVIRHLETADENHRQWLRALHGALLCGGSFGPEVLDPQAHRHCRFGQWYYGNDLALLQDRSDYQALEAQHRLMHDSARHMVRQQQGGTTIPDWMYREFMDRQELFSSSLLALRDHLREYLFSFDTLTGVMTREPFMAQLAAQMERGRRSGEAAVVALLDVDHFKGINDSYGHLVGDRVLGELGQFLLRRLRRYDLLCRYGGEEFLLCLPGASVAEAVPVMDRLRAELAELEMGIDGGSTIQITASIGLAALLPDQGSEVSIANADQALYAAKAAGRNRVVSYPLAP